MAYKELRDKLFELDDDQLDMDVVVSEEHIDVTYNYSVCRFDLNQRSGPFDSNQPRLVYELD